MAEQITNYQCPTCTGPLRFSGATGKMECEYCGSSFEVKEIEQLYAAANAQAEAEKEKADAQQNTEDEWSISETTLDGSGMKVYNCPSCGAELICDESTAASSCPYCGNPTVVPGQFTGMLQPDYVIPFKYEKEQALDALKKHYGKRFLLPRSFKDTHHLEEVKGVYVPFWLYDGETYGDCTYKAEKVRTHREGDYEVTIKDIYHVERSGALAFEKIPADASSHMADDLMDSIEPYNYNDLKAFQKAYLVGYMADKYDETAEENAERALQRAKESTREFLRNDVSGYSSVSTSSENIRVKEGKVHYAMMPVWMLHTKWQNKDYMFAMNGQTGKMVGDLPVDGAKLTITTIIAALLTFLICNFVFDCSAGVSIVATLIVAGVLALILYNSMKSVAKAATANNYMKENSVRITHREDRFVRRERSRRKIESNK